MPYTDKHFSVSAHQAVKSSAIRGIRNKLVESYPALEPVIDTLIPKKANLVLVKCVGQVTAYAVDGEILFFQHFDGKLIPHLHLVHKYPSILPQAVVDRGAIRHVLKGADIMCPGLTSEGGRLPSDEELNLQPGGDVVATGDGDDVSVVAVYGQNKEHAMAVGLLRMSPASIRTLNTGIGIENVHHLGDGLWTHRLDILSAKPAK